MAESAGKSERRIQPSGPGIEAGRSGSEVSVQRRKRGSPIEGGGGPADRTRRRIRFDRSGEPTTNPPAISVADYYVRN